LDSDPFRISKQFPKIARARAFFQINVNLVGNSRRRVSRVRCRLGSDITKDSSPKDTADRSTSGYIYLASIPAVAKRMRSDMHIVC